MFNIFLESINMCKIASFWLVRYIRCMVISLRFRRESDKKEGIKSTYLGKFIYLKDKIRGK